MKAEYDASGDGCFVCGKGNRRGLRLDFTYDEQEDRVCTRCRFETYTQGYDRIVHGGFVSMLLDEVMAKACLQKELKAVTARMEVRFSAPVYVEEEVEVCGRIEEVRGKRIRASAVCWEAGRPKTAPRATAEALFILA